MQLSFSKFDKAEILDRLLKLSLVVAAIWSFIEALYLGRLNDQWVAFAMTVLTLFLVVAPEALLKKYGIKLPQKFYLIITVFIYLSVYLGSTQRLYWSIEWYDTLLHVTGGVLLGFIGLVLLSVLQKHRSVEFDPLIVSFFAFCFSVTFLTLWEVYEFLVDTFFGLEMQWGHVDTIVDTERRGAWLVDTMLDLIVGIVGAVFVSVLGYYSLREKDSTVKQWAIEILRANIKLFAKKKDKEIRKQND